MLIVRPDGSSMGVVLLVIYPVSPICFIIDMSAYALIFSMFYMCYDKVRLLGVAAVLLIILVSTFGGGLLVFFVAALVGRESSTAELLMFSTVAVVTILERVLLSSHEAICVWFLWVRILPKDYQPIIRTGSWGLSKNSRLDVAEDADIAPPLLGNCSLPLEAVCQQHSSRRLASKRPEPKFKNYIILVRH
jgi:hypothetical protein